VTSRLQKLNVGIQAWLIPVLACCRRCRLPELDRCGRCEPGWGADKVLGAKQLVVRSRHCRAYHRAENLASIPPGNDVGKPSAADGGLHQSANQSRYARKRSRVGRHVAPSSSAQIENIARRAHRAPTNTPAGNRYHRGVSSRHPTAMFLADAATSTTMGTWTPF